MDTKDGFDMSAKRPKIGNSQSANIRSAMSREHVPNSYYRKAYINRQPRKTPEDKHADLVVFIGKTLAFVFAGSVLGIVYALIFVTQPVGAQAPNDRDFIGLLTNLTVFLTGSLGGVLASNGLKSKPKSNTPEEIQQTDKKDVP